MKPILRLQNFATIKDNPKLKIFDVRTGPQAFQNYKNEHLKNASFVSLDNDLAEIGDFGNGGRHPLPTIDKFAKSLSRLGILADDHIVIYDDKSGGNAAARFWWMLKSVGHDKVQVLDGGLQAAISFGLATESGNFKYPTSYYKAENWRLPLKDISEVDNATKDSKKIIIDVREVQRYQGLTEPIDLVAGHIPNAINIPYVDNLDEQGYFKSSVALREIYEALFQQYQPDNIIVHCGSGVTACHTILAMDEAGFGIPNLYVGSWSEWSRNKF